MDTRFNRSMLRALCATVASITLVASGSLVIAQAEPNDKRSDDRVAIEVPESVQSPSLGSIAVPMRALEVPNSSKAMLVRLRAVNGFVWGAVASLGTRISQDTVQIPLDALRKAGGTKARLTAPARWNESAPILLIEFVDGSGQTIEQRAVRASNRQADIDLFMFPPQTRSKVRQDRTVTYDFRYGNQGVKSSGGTFTLEALNGFTFAVVPPDCAQSPSPTAVTCWRTDIPKHGVLTVTLKAPQGAPGIVPALRYKITPTGAAADQNPDNDGGVRYAELGA